MRMMRKTSRKLRTALPLAVVLMLALPLTAFADISIDVATLAAGGVTVPPEFLAVGPGATISASIAVQVGDGSYDAWKSTSWRIATSSSSGLWTCVDTPDHNNVGTYTENFDITAPTTPGIYNVYFRAHNTSNCPDEGMWTYYDSISLSNSVLVDPNLDLIESYGAGCTTQQDDFGEGQGVCMQATGLDSGPWQIRWTDPDLSSVRSVDAQVDDGEYSDSWSPVPCKTGTWIVELREREYNPATHTYVYDTVDLDTFTLSCGPALASYQTDCSTADDDFDVGEAVCMKGTALGANPLDLWRIQWWAPGASSATRTRQAPVLTTGSYSDSWEPNPCVAGTWTVSLDRGKLLDPLSGWSTEDTDTFNLTCGACTPPSITTQPVNQTITYGDDASFTVAGTDYTSVQWQVNPGTGWSDITGATSATLHLTQPAVSLNGTQYRAVLTGDCGPAATSAPATLTVNPDPFDAFSGLTSSLNPSVYGDTVTFTAVVSTSGGAPAGKVIFLEFVVEDFTSTQIPLGEDATAAPLGENSYEYTFSTSTLAIGDHAIFAAYDDGNGISPAYAGPLYQTVEEQIWPTVTITSAPPETSYSTQATFEFSSDPEGAGFECSLSEADVFSPENMTWSACNSPQVYTDLSYGVAYTFAVKVQGAPLTASTLAEHQWYIALPQVTITGGPAEVTESTEATLTFSSDPAGVDLECYLVAQEYGTQNALIVEDWAPCTSPRTLTGLSRGYVYYFGVKPEGVAENYAATRQWRITRITLAASPTPSQFGSDVTFTATLWDDSGTAPGGTVAFAELIYSWPGIMTPQPFGQVSSHTASGTGWYAYTFSTSELAIGSHDIIALYTDEGGTFTSLPITQEVTEVTAQTPVITTQPANRTVCAGSSVSFAATANGTPVPTVQWQVSNDSGATWSSISGATTATYAFTAVAGDDGKWYRAVFTNSAGSATSSAAILTVYTAPAVTTQPTNQMVTYGVPSATFSATASGTAPSVQWQRSTDGTTWTAMSSATTANLTIANPTVSLSGTRYRAVFSNLCGTATSSAATMTVNKAPVTASFTAADKGYDGTTAATVLTRDLSGVLSGDDVSLTGAATFSDKNVGTGKTVTLKGASLSGTDAGNYVLESVATTTADIQARRVGVKPNSGQSKVYGDADPTLTYTVGGDGLVAGDSFTGALSRDSGDDVGFYAITPGTLAIEDGNGGHNYDLTFTTGVDFEITKATSTVAVTCPDSVVYNGTAQTPCTAEAIGPGMSPVDVTTSLVYASNTDVGTATAGANWNGDTNHTGNTGSGSFEITPAAVTMTAGDYSGTYDGAVHSLSACEVTGAYTGDLSCTNDPASVGPDVGSGGVAPLLALNGETETNFTVTFQDGSWSITPAPVTATAGSYKATYDGASHSPSDCVVTADAPNTFKGDLTCTNDPSSVGPGVGSGTVEVDDMTGTGLSNFAITKVDGSWEITPAPVTATAGSYNGTYDGVAHSPECLITGDYTGDLTCTNDPSSVGPDVGWGTVTVDDVSGAGLSNFAITKVDGSWEITPAPVTATAGSYNATYDDASHSPSACVVTPDAPNTYKGDLTCTNDPASVGPGVGSGIVAAQVSGTGLTNFDITKVDGSWSITKATLTVTADDQTAQYSDVSPDPLTFQYDGFQGDDDEDDLTAEPTCQTDRVPSDPASPPTFAITCSGGEDDNYTFEYEDGTFTVELEDATITLDNPNGELVDVPGSDDSGPFSLFAYVQETKPDVGYGPAAGDISFAEVSMSLTPVGPGSGATGTCIPDGDNGKSGYEKVAKFKCDFDELGVNTYLIETILVGDYYTGSPAEDVLVVYDPSLGFTTAGGWFYWPGTNDKTSFGYTMKYNKKGNQVQGNLLLIRHTDDGNYRLKSNALDGLALGEFEEEGQFVGWASFSGKCTYQEPDWLEPEGNHAFLVYVEDWGEPGAGYDRFWIGVSDDGDNLSLGSDAQDDWVLLNGGNIVVPHTPN